ncbi:MAG: protein-glutamate O-methyltransferase CheR [Gemmatimonadetes bacterium]|nr:protein-glutamate O-methyltransferase CheR [Gemmatimonadota bacterium]
MLPDHGALVELLRERTGLVFGPARHRELEAAILRAAQRAGAADATGCAERILHDPVWLDDLIADLTVGETYFFREPAQLEFIAGEIIDPISREQPSTGTFRAWSAGCASGEEAYSLAILLGERGLRERAHVIGTDLSRHRLLQARKARYSGWALRGMPAATISTYFVPEGRLFALSPAIRRAVEFRYLNLAEDSYPSLATGIWGMDLILCRNVLIYLDRETITRVAQRLIDTLTDDGWLFLGASDPPLADLVPCQVVVTGAGIAYRRPGRAGSASAPDPRGARPAVLFARGPRTAAPAEPGPAPDREEACAAGGHTRAAELAVANVEADEGDLAGCVLRVRALANQGRLDEAGQACSAALERHRMAPELLYLHAVLLAEGGRHAESAAAARRALYLDRGLTVAHITLASALARLGDVPGAARALRNAEHLLRARPAAEIVPASDGEPAGRLLSMTRAQLRLLDVEAR